MSDEKKREELKAKINEELDELSLEDLEKVAGGGAWSSPLNLASADRNVPVSLASANSPVSLASANIPVGLANGLASDSTDDASTLTYGAKATPVG